MKKNILITGGTGSFGKNFIKKILKKDLFKKIIIFSRDEFKQTKMAQELKSDKRLRFFLGDVRDKERLTIATKDTDIIIHAAALKHVPIAEYNPYEFVKTNIIGSENIAKVALLNKVKKTILLSTDKAANPANLYGATKLCAEKIFISSNYYSNRNDCSFSVVRYGNVINSRGSVLPHFKQLIDQGSKYLPVTDKRMTRFFITFDRAIDFVLYVIKHSIGSEIFVPKLPSLKIFDLAKSLVSQQRIKIIGVRPGEKLHEKMITWDESRQVIELKDSYVILPDQTFKKIDYVKTDYFKKGKLLKKNFNYSSDLNDKWLKENEIKKILRDG